MNVLHCGGRMRWGALVFFLFLCYAVAFFGGLWTEYSVHGWYTTLHKSSLTPPNIAFPIVWTVLYTLMAISAWLIWRTAPNLTLAKSAYFFFFLQLGFNLFWSFFFFGQQRPVAALWDAILLNLAAWGMFYTFYNRSRVAAWLQIPYLIWIAFALYLNAHIVMFN